MALKIPVVGEALLVKDRQVPLLRALEVLE
jgi:hypothetical protein